MNAQQAQEARATSAPKREAPKAPDMKATLDRNEKERQANEAAQRAAEAAAFSGGAAGSSGGGPGKQGYACQEQRCTNTYAGKCIAWGTFATTCYR